MKRIVFALGFFLGITASGFSQDVTRRDGGKLEAYKVAVLTNRLKLSIDEAQKFWPIYNKYKDEIRQVRRADRNIDEIALEERVVNIRKKYKSEFTHALPEERVNQFFKVEKEFNNTVRKELQERELKQMRLQNKRPITP